MSLTALGVGAGARLAGNLAQRAFADSEKKTQLNLKYLTDQAAILAQELGQLKGSVMKVGQMLSMYGEHFLPPEANRLLKSLQNESPPVVWDEMRKVLVSELGEDKLQKLEIKREAFASASLGQVHLATEKATGLKLALKIQYPGVDQAIDSDLKTLKRLLSLSRLVPADYNLDEIFAEVEMILSQEVDYTKEKEWTQVFRERLKDDKRYIIPQVFDDYSSSKVLATSFEEGINLDHPRVLALSQERRNRLGENFLELYLREIFQWGEVQTDPHFGNYRVRLNESGEDQLILLDFGAVRRFDQAFLEKYYKMSGGAHRKNQELLESGVNALGFLRPGDSEEHRRLFYDICVAITEPFQKDKLKEGVYDWGKSDLPQRLLARTGEVLRAFKLRPPPREIIFLDRKLGGVFVALSRLGAKTNSIPILESYLGAALNRVGVGGQKGT